MKGIRLMPGIAILLFRELLLSMRIRLKPMALPTYMRRYFYGIDCETPWRRRGSGYRIDYVTPCVGVQVTAVVEVFGPQM